MNDFQKNLLLRRKHYRERRNTVRKILFILSLILFFFVLYFILQIPNTGPAAIELSKNHLIKSEYIVQNISKEISGRNFFFISPRYVLFVKTFFNPFIERPKFFDKEFNEYFLFKKVLKRECFLYE